MILKRKRKEREKEKREKEKKENFIEINRDAQFFAASLAEALGALDTLLGGRVRDGDERTDVDGAHTRMCAAVVAHVDQFLCKHRCYV